MTVPVAFEATANRLSKRLAFATEKDSETYSSLAERSWRIAGGLQAAGVEQGDRVAILLTTSSDYVASFLGVLRLGGVAILLDPRLAPKELSRILIHAKPQAIVSENVTNRGSIEPFLETLRSDLGNLKCVVFRLGSTRSWTVSLGDLEKSSPLKIKGSIPNATDVAAVFYSSGTSGEPRGAVHTHETLLAAVTIARKTQDEYFAGSVYKRIVTTFGLLSHHPAKMMRAAFGDRVWMTPLPVYSISGNSLLLQGIMSGELVVGMERFNPRLAFDLITRYRVTVLAITPTIANLLLRARGSRDVSSLAVVGLGGSPVPPELARQVGKEFRCKVAISYGSTELGGGIASTRVSDRGDSQFNTVGRALSGVEVRVLDSLGRPAAAGTPGELVCRSESQMRQYESVSGPEIDSRGWHYTGDLAKIDGSGNITILGRTREMIIRSGRNIFPLEIEQVLDSHPSVEKSAVLGVQHKIAGETVWAFVVYSEDVQLPERELMDYCARRLSDYKVPERIIALSELPTTAEGKIQKFKLEGEVQRILAR